MDNAQQMIKSDKKLFAKFLVEEYSRNYTSQPRRPFPLNSVNINTVSVIR